MPIIDYSKKAKASENRFFDCEKITEKNKKAVKTFLNGYDVSSARLDIFFRHLKHFLELSHDIKNEMKDRDEINKIFKELRGKLSPSVYNTVINVSSRFVRWLNEGLKPKGFFDVKYISKKKEKRDLKPEDMVTLEDVDNMIRATMSLQLKAVIAAQLDGGFRPSEFIDLTFGDIKQDKEFIIVTVKDGKTGGRPVILWRSVPHLLRWLKAHPVKKKDSPLWVQENQTHGRIKKYNYWALQKRIRELGAKINLDKPLDFYNLRHSSCRQSKLDNIPEEEAAKKYGHSLKYYTETYGRLSTEDSVDRLKKAYGLNVEKEKVVEKTIVCSRCDFVNLPESDGCEKCGAPLSMKAALQSDKENKELKQKMADLEKTQEKNKLKDDFIMKILKGLELKGKISDAVELIHEEKMEKQLADLFK